MNAGLGKNCCGQGGDLSPTLIPRAISSDVTRAWPGVDPEKGDMSGALRLFLGLFFLQTIAFIGLSVYARRVRRRQLEARWREKPVSGSGAAYVERGLRAYDKSLRRKMIWGVYVLPWAAILAVIYVVNYM